MRKNRNLNATLKLIQNSVQSNQWIEDLNLIVLNQAPLSVPARIEIYQQAYLIRMVESLRDDFEELEATIGENSFRQFAEKYVLLNPSRHRNLAEYSQGFLDFTEFHLPEYYELVLECWMKIISARAGDLLINISQDEIANGTPFSVRTYPHVVTRNIKDHGLLVYRKNGEFYTMKIKKIEFEFLQFLKTERSIEEIEIFAIEGNFNPQKISDLMFVWIKDGIVACLKKEIQC